MYETARQLAHAFPTSAPARPHLAPAPARPHLAPAPARPHLAPAPAPPAASPERTAGSFAAVLRAAPEGDQATAVLSVRGEVDLTTAPNLRDVLLLAQDRGSLEVLVDLSEVSFMDSTGVQVLVAALGRLEAEGRRLVLRCSEHGQVRRLLDLVGLLGLVSAQAR